MTVDLVIEGVQYDLVVERAFSQDLVLLAGSKGDAGAKGDQGDPGPQGIQGIQGLQGDQGIQGDQGDPGPQGIQGIQGIPGADGSPARIHAYIDNTDSPYTIPSGTTEVFADATAGAITINGPAVSSVEGLEHNVMKTDASANAVTFDPDGAETVNGSATVSISGQFESLSLFPTDIEWFVI